MMRQRSFRGPASVSDLSASPKCLSATVLLRKQIGKFMSEVLVLGFPDAKGEVVLIQPSQHVPNGGRLF
jgi:hypothetical protein